ncbi:MAG: hypothetical protein ACOWWR_17465 [Eubacteriales bacterium]
MQNKDAIELRKRWLAKGNPPCDHPELEREYFLGADSGDYVCLICGESGWGSDWPKKEREKKDGGE